MSNELWKMSATDLAAAIRGKQVTSREVVEAHLRRIEQVNPGLNAVVVTLADDALRGAEAADRELSAGGRLGPLHGVPFTIKENIDLAGSATTQGIAAMAEAIPPLDAPQVAQLKAAGAIPIGRTNLPDFGLRWHTDNGLRGATKNPWDPTRTPGGSSGGEAVALATGMTPLGLGNDLGGSLRWPTQCNGVAALKPSMGRIPDATSLPPEEATLTLQLMAVQGPMARYVRDLRAAFESMIGPDARDPLHTPAPFRSPEAPKRVAVTIDPAGEGVDEDVAAGVRRAADALKDAGYEIIDIDPPLVAEARDVWAQLLLAEVRTGLLPVLQQVACADALVFLNHALGTVPELDYGGYIMGWAQRQGIAKAWSQFQAQFPIILGPVSCGQPFEVGFDLEPGGPAALLKDLRLVVTLNFLGLPAAVVPVGVANGLPQAVQVIGGRFREDLCLDAAEAIEARIGPLTPIDPR
ncbi:MAG: amidase [Hyphomicrobiales bacterium]